MSDDFVRVAAQGIVSLPDASVTAAKIADGVITPIKLTGGYTETAVNYGASINDRVIDATGTTAVTLPTSVGNVGRQYIIRNNGSATVTIATTGGQTIDGSATLVLAGKGFAEVIADGSGWHVLRAQYADETIGRRMFNWNHAYSTGGGWQMTYGDTGVRNVSSLLINSWTTTATVQLSRIGNLVTLTFYGNLVGTSATSAYFMTAIPGFRGAGGNSYGVFVASDNSARMAYFDLYSGWAIDTYGNATYKQATFTYRTPDAWPSSLPGSAVGSIPQ